MTALGIDDSFIAGLICGVGLFCYLIIISIAAEYLWRRVRRWRRPLRPVIPNVIIRDNRL